ncbi:MAG: ABC transporter permease [Zhenhengia sp.]|uniref:ABC transporter permease n=1 Tax=Zhenhengia sp. TaxID=2944208 RepID=UPI0039930672
MQTWKKVMRYKQIYLLILPALIYFLIFCYGPMYGIQLAFKDYNALNGITGSPWVGLAHFERFFNSYQFEKLLWNTVSLSLEQLLFGFPIPIILALSLNYARSSKFKKLVQTVTYAPHFISIVVLVGMLNIFFAINGGLVNEVITALGFEPILFMGKEKYFQPLFVGSGIWQNMGWNAIIYLAALSGVNPELHEAALADGASKIRRIWHIDLPTIRPTVIIMLILNFGQLMGIGFEKAFLMQNSLNMGKSEIIATYVYKIGLVDAQYGFATAVGLFNSVINFVLLITVNYISKKVSETSLW